MSHHDPLHCQTMWRWLGANREQIAMNQLVRRFYATGLRSQRRLSCHSPFSNVLPTISVANMSVMGMLRQNAESPSAYFVPR